MLAFSSLWDGVSLLSLIAIVWLSIEMPSKPHFARPHIGKVPMKFYFRCQDITVELPGIDVRGQLELVWKRGYRRTSTGHVPCATNRKIWLCNEAYSCASGPPEPFVVREELNSIDGSLHRFASTTQVPSATGAQPDERRNSW